jgi:hypothetical protein
LDRWYQVSDRVFVQFAPFLDLRNSFNLIVLPELHIDLAHKQKATRRMILLESFFQLRPDVAGDKGREQDFAILDLRFLRQPRQIS